MFRRLFPLDDNQPGENVFVFTTSPDGKVTFEVRNAETNVLFGNGRRIK